MAATVANPFADLIPQASTAAPAAAPSLVWHDSPEEANANAPPDTENYLLTGTNTGKFAWVPKSAGAPKEGMPRPSETTKEGTAPPENPFADLIPQGGQQPRKQSGLANDFAAGANGVVADTLGAPIDIISNVTHRLQQEPPLGEPPYKGGTKYLPSVEQFLGYVARLLPEADPDKEFGGSASIKRGMGLIAENPDEVQPGTTAGKLAKAAGAGTASMVLPFGAARAAKTLGATGDIVDTLSQGTVASNARMGAVAGASGEGAREAAPEPWKRVAEFVGNLFGGGLEALTSAGARSLYRVGTDQISRAVAPFTEAGRERLAGERIARAASDRDELASRLVQGTPELVPGSNPTTFQLTGDQGVGQLERGARTQTPAPFLARAAEQNAARVGQINALAPEGNPAAVGDFFHQQLADMDARHDAVVNAARDHVTQTIDAMGGAGAQAADQHVTALQDYGAKVRGYLNAANLAAKGREKSLWDAIDPKGTLTMDASPVPTAAGKIKAEMPTMAEPMSPKEQAIFDTAATIDRIAPFSEIRALRSRLQSAIREERFLRGGESQALRRMTQLQGAIDGAIGTAAERQAQREAQAVAEGRMAPEETLTGRVQAWQQEWYNRRNAATQSAVAAGSDGGRGAGKNAGRGPVAVSGVPGAESAPNGRPGNAAGDQGLPGEASTPFDAEAAERYRVARQATRERKQTFKTGPVGQALAPGQGGTQYRMAPSQVAARFFNSGKTAADDIQAYIKAIGDRLGAISALEDYAAFSLRRAAERPDGTLNLTAHQRWMAAHEEALSAFPELKQTFEAAARAQETLDNSIAARIADRKQYESTAAQHFLNAEPAVAVRRALSSANPEQTFSELVGLTRGNAAASAGLRRAVVEHITSTLLGNAEGAGTNLIKSDAFQTFARKNARALGQLFTPEQMTNIRNIAADLQRSNRSVQGSKIPGGSNTPQDTAQAARFGGNGSWLSHAIVPAIGAAVGHVVAPFAGSAAGAFGAEALHMLRLRGIGAVDGLVTEAMLDPALAARLLQKVPRIPPENFQQRLTRQLRANALASAGYRAAGVGANRRDEAQAQP